MAPAGDLLPDLLLQRRDVVLEHGIQEGEAERDHAKLPEEPSHSGEVAGHNRLYDLAPVLGHPD